MSLGTVWHLIGLGGIAGVIPIYIGIAAALLAVKISSRSWEGFLTGISTGILVYLFFDLMHEAVELTAAQDPLSWLIFLGSVLVGFVGLVALEQQQQGRHRSPDSSPLFLPYMISLGLGLHNLGEGLAIGASYAQGAWTLSGLLVGGFALHNGTEGFAIIASAGKSRLPLKEVVLMGLVAGAPTSLGAVISGGMVSPYLSIIFYALAAGSLLYVVFSLVTIFYTATRRMQTATGVFAGLSLMYVTAMLLTIVTGIKS
jgi:zinc transporter, ZIP family